MFNNENKVSFRHDKDGALCIEYHCGKCNSHTDITDLVYELCKYGQNGCPNNLHQAWKILRLGSSEYADDKGQPELEHNILISALCECPT